MHHCMVDRLFAMWQDLYPDKYVQPFSTSAGRLIDPDLPLAPFSKDTQGTPVCTHITRTLSTSLLPFDFTFKLELHMYLR